MWDYVCLIENIRVSWKNENFLRRTKITGDNFQLTAELEIPGLGWMMAQYLKSIFHTLEIMTITWKTCMRPPATRIKLWIICTWRYRARESGIFHITWCFSMQNLNLSSMTLLDVSYYFKNRYRYELLSLNLFLNANFRKILGLNCIKHLWG